MLLVLLVLIAADTSHTVNVAVAPGESLSVTIVGEGAPVVLLPGLFGASYSFRRVMGSLDSAGYRAVGIEPLGMGLSGRPKDANYSLAAQADRIAAVMDTLGIAGAVFVAHSLGSSIALRVAYREPWLVSGIVSLEGGATEQATTPGFRRWMRFAPIIRLMNGYQIMLRKIYRSMKKVSFDDSWVTGSVLQAYTAGPARNFKASLAAYKGMARSEEPELLRDHLAEITCPVVLLVSEVRHGSGPPADEMKALTERLYSFAIDTIPRSGFFIQEEQPSAVVSAVRDMSVTAGRAR
ncbi:MAG: alpha/beta fold hydrolase [Gemmatimonadales bacterium]